MPEVILADKYTESDEFIRKGDLVSVDDQPGFVDEVCPVGTALARDYSCEKMGGLLIQFDDGTLVLLPFGTYHYISKRM